MKLRNPFRGMRDRFTRRSQRVEEDRQRERLGKRLPINRAKIRGHYRRKDKLATHMRHSMLPSARIEYTPACGHTVRASRRHRCKV